jgi:hypothetical protein
VGPDYCRSACGDRVCADCPRPRLLPAAVFGVEAYLACRTQWALCPNGRLLGLRYDACLPQLHLLREKWRLARRKGRPGVVRLMDMLRTLEHALIAAAAEREANTNPPRRD